MFTLLIGAMIAATIFILLFSFQLIVMFLKDLHSFNMMVLKDFARLFSGFGKPSRRQRVDASSFQMKSIPKSKTTNNIYSVNKSSITVADKTNGFNNWDSVVKNEKKYIKTPMYNPLRPDKGFYRTSLDDPQMQKFITECNNYVEKRDIEDAANAEKNGSSSKAKKDRSRPKKIIDQETKRKQSEISNFKRMAKQYKYKDDDIEKFANSIIQIGQAHKFIEGDEIFGENYRGVKAYKKYLLQAVHIYIDYGFITAKMVAYGLDIPLKYAYLIVEYLFGKELPEASSTIDNELLLRIGRDYEQLESCKQEQIMERCDL